MIRVTFLGTAAGRPTVRRNVSALTVQRESDVMLFDCGEGTQRQMMRYGTGFQIRRIFITHLHADHFLGLTGLLRTLSLQDHTDPIQVFGPPGSKQVLSDTVHLGVHRIPFPVEIMEIGPGDVIQEPEYDVVAIEATHRIESNAYALIEHKRLGRFDVERARALGVPEGPAFGRLHRGESVDIEGRIITPDELVGPTRPGRRLVYSGDTRPCEAIEAAAAGAALLIHESTFSQDDAGRAHSTFHSTARAAAELAARAGVRRLALTHISARYSEDASPLAEEAKEAFAETVVARDGLTIEIPYEADEGPEIG